MKISLTKAGKRYNREWIFRNLSYEFFSGNSYAITGPNGSGKSTLLQAIGGALMLSEGAVSYELRAVSHELQAMRQEEEENSSEPKTMNFTESSENSATTNQQLQTINSLLQPDTIYQHLSIAAPYLELIEEMTIIEFLNFHKQFKPLLSSLSVNTIISTVGLEKAANKQIRYYSSGMKQRLKLAQAIFSDVPVILLDEPCTNLDAEGIALYQQLITEYCKHRILIVSSNDEVEYGFCTKRIRIMDYK